MTATDEHEPMRCPRALDLCCRAGAKRECNGSFSKSHNFMSAVLGLSGPFSDGFKRRAVDPKRTLQS